MTYELTEAARVWNRACRGECPNPGRGDRALAALLYAHGYAMNGGVLHAVECLTLSELSEAQSGYCFLGLEGVAELLSRARRIFEEDDDLGDQESLLDNEYWALVPDDSSLVERFEKHLSAHPADFAPL